MLKLISLLAITAFIAYNAQNVAFSVDKQARTVKMERMQELNNI